jgi:hypothetical protein
VPVQEAITVTAAIPSRETTLFVVHVWRQHSQFRASVRRVDFEQSLLFTTPTQLASYLWAASGGPLDAGSQPLSEPARATTDRSPPDPCSTTRHLHHQPEGENT